MRGILHSQRSSSFSGKIRIKVETPPWGAYPPGYFNKSVGFENRYIWDILNHWTDFRILFPEEGWILYDGRCNGEEMAVVIEAPF